MKSNLVKCETLSALGLQIRSAAKGRKAFLITDENVSDFWLAELLPLIDKKGLIDIVEIEAGEDSKSPEVAFHITQHLIDANAGKDSIIINLGGGMVCDLGGFVASIYKRGIDHINVPTTLLAMIDAASGGKTGVNQGGIKNVIGSFHSAKQVLLYSDFLSTLPLNELKSGYGEMLKHGILAGPKLWQKLIHLKTETIPPTDIILACLAVKEKIVKSDPLELGPRKLLNLGHSFGHAYESFYLQSGKLLPHGICVALGMITETVMAKNMKHAIDRNAEQIIQGIQGFFPSGQFALPAFEEIRTYLFQDKKNQRGKLRMTLPVAIGKVLYDVEVSEAAAKKAHEFVRTFIV